MPADRPVSTLTTTKVLAKTKPRPPIPAVPARLDRDALTASYREAVSWAEHGYSATSRSYWQGMRDTLAVILGITTAPPTVSCDDAAATVLLRRRG
jgi:hypothetical protein